MATPESVAEAAGGEQQAGEHDRVRGDDPLQLGGAGTEVADESRHGDVDDRMVDGGDEQGEHEHAEDVPAPWVAGTSGFVGLGGWTTVHGDSLRVWFFRRCLRCG